jgi:hypothetical protein
VMCSDITSASTASRAFAANMSNAMGFNFSGYGITVTGLVAVPAVRSWDGVSRKA